MPKFYATGFWVERNLGPWVTIILVMVNFGLSISILVGGIDRFVSPSYDPLVDLTNGKVWIWGVIILFSALLTSVPFRRLNIIGLWISMAWHILWAACFVIASIQYENTASTPIPVYSGLAMLSAALLTARAIDKSKG